MLQVGSSKAPEGSQVYALSAKGGVLTLAPTERSKARATVPIEDTDFKEVLGGIYEKWKASMVEMARARHEYRIAQRERLSEMRASGDSSALVGAGERPEQEEDGKVPVMLESMWKGEVTEVSPEIV